MAATYACRFCQDDVSELSLCGNDHCERLDCIDGCETCNRNPDDYWETFDDRNYYGDRSA